MVEKPRYVLRVDEVVIGLDHYKNSKDEEWLAEVEFPSAEAMRSFELSIPYLREVTGFTDYEGYALAMRYITVTW